MIFQTKELGWNGEDNLHVVANGKQIGGDRFYDHEKKLPFAVGRIWYEADINYKQGVRNKHRIVYSNDGLVFVTYDLYETFFEIVGVAGNKKANPQTGGSTRYSSLQDAIDDYGGEASLPDVVKKAQIVDGSTGGGTKGPNPNTDDSKEYVYWSDSYNVNYRTKPVVGNGGKVYYYTQYYSFITGWRYFDIYDYNPQQMSQSKGLGEVAITVNDWLRLYANPTVTREGRTVNCSGGYAFENLSNINKWARVSIQNTTGVAPTINVGNKGELTDGDGRYWIAVGPNVMNPSHDKDKAVTADEMKYGTFLDVVVQDSSGNMYYIPAVVGDAKVHTYPTGIVQTGNAFPSGTDSHPQNNDGSVVEFIGAILPAGLSEYKIVSIIVYDK